MNKLIIKNKKNRELNSIEEWEMGFVEVDDKSHWEEGYSAHSIGKFFTCEEGKEWLKNLTRDLFGEEMYYEDAEIEHESKLDTYKGKHRMQDLAIWGTILGKKVFIAIEAKVLESFGNHSVKDEYELAVQEHNKNTNSNKLKRIEEIVGFLFPGKTPNDEPVCSLRYQLMHYFTASIKEAQSLAESKTPIRNRKTHLSTIVLPVLVFKTKHYYEDIETGKNNKKDYMDFVFDLGFETKQVGSRTIYQKNIHQCEVFTVYEEIDLL